MHKLINTDKAQEFIDKMNEKYPEKPESKIKTVLYGSLGQQIKQLCRHFDEFKCFVLREMMRFKDEIIKVLDDHEITSEELEESIHQYMIKNPIEIPEVDLSDYATKEDLENIEVVSSWNDLTDKPFYSEAGEEVDLFPSQELTFDLFDGVYSYQPAEAIVIEESKTYIVIWDGNKYECIAKSISSDGLNFCYIGDGSLLGGEESSEPFNIAYSSELSMSMLATKEMGTTHTIRIYQGGEVIHKLDMKYIDTDAIKNIVNDVITEALNSEV